MSKQPGETNFIGGDTDLGLLGAQKKRDIVEARLDALSAQLYEALLNRAQAVQTDATPQAIAELDAVIAGLRLNIRLHRDELARL